MNEIVIVGASLAGVESARALRSLGYEGRLNIFGEEPHPPYDRPPLSKGFLLGAVADSDLALVDEQEELGVTWRTGVRAVGLDCAARRVILDEGDELRGDGVVLATGASALRLPHSDGLEGIHMLRTLGDALALRAALASARRVVVVGSGFIGCEVAASARQLGLEVTLVSLTAMPLQLALGARRWAAPSALCWPT